MVKDIILDVDPGVDDIIAALFAKKLPELNLEGITTVAGNIGVEQGTENILRVLSYIDSEEIPVAKGFHKPLIKKYHMAKEVHGRNGMAGVELPETDKEPVDEHAIDFIIRKAKELGNLTLVPVGPLTNIAIALRKAPEIQDNIDEMVIMVGAFNTKGNTAPLSEFNIYTDPEAARMVLGSEIPIKMAPLDVTTKLPTKEKTLEKLEKGETLEAELAYKILMEHRKKIYKKYGIELHMHDSLGVYMATGSHLVKTKKIPVSVETKGELSYGETVGDFRENKAPWQGVVGDHPSATKAEVGVEVDRGEFYGSLIKALTG